MQIKWLFAISLIFLTLSAEAESIRALITGTLEVALDKPGSSIALKQNEAALISLTGDTRFLRGIELELTTPQRWPSYQGSLAMSVYAELDKVPAPGERDIQAKSVAFEALPGKMNIVHQLPVRPGHGLRNSPYATVLSNIVRSNAFPILYRIVPIVKGLSDELENMSFQLIARPILSDEGVVKLNLRYPSQLRGKPITVLIDDVLIRNPLEEQMLKEGEHHVVILSEDYRNENRRFIIERTKTLDLTIELQDPTPLLIFEAPQNARIFLNNNPVTRGNDPLPVEPGEHEVKFQVGDYTLTKTLSVQRGKTYRVAMTVDINVQEDD